MLKQIKSALVLTSFLVTCFAITANGQTAIPSFADPVKSTLQPAGPSNWVSLATPGDFDRDGKQDIVVIGGDANGSPVLYAMYGNGQGGMNLRGAYGLFSGA